MANKGLKRTLHEFRVYCPHRLRGCEWEGELGRLDEHLNSDPLPERQLKGCPFAVIECLHCKEGIRRDKIAGHQLERCPQRPYTCEYCAEYKSTFEDVVHSHWPECESILLPCPNECMPSGSGIQRQYLDQHLKEECPLTVVQCELHHAGCEMTMPRKDMADHMKKNSIVHISLLAAENHRLNKRLLEKEEQITRTEKDGAQVVTSQSQEFTQKVTCLDQELTRSRQKLTQTEQKLTQTEQKLTQTEQRFASQSQEFTQEVNCRDQELTRCRQKLMQTEQKLTQTEQKLMQTEQKLTQTEQNHMQKVIFQLQELTRVKQELRRLDTSQSQELTRTRKELTRTKHELKQKECDPQMLRNDVMQSDIAPVTIEMAGFDELETNATWHSRPFYTGMGGYKMCLNVDANSTGTHVSVFTCLMRGEFDSRLNWPFRGTVTIQLVNQLEDRKRHTVHYTYTDTTSDECAAQVTGGEQSRAIGLGLTRFILHSDLGLSVATNRQYLKDDCLIFHVSVKL